MLLDESCDPEKVFAENNYGLFFDRPENEFHKWNGDYRTSQNALDYIAKQRSRSVRKSVGQMHISSEISDVNISRLTPLQVDDVRKYTENEEDEMVSSTPPDLAEVTLYKERLAEESKKVKKTIRHRMTKKTVFVLSSICLGLFLACFLPFLFSNISSTQTVTATLALSLGMCGVLAIVMLVTLFVLRASVLNAVRDYNNVAHEIVNDIQDSLKRFSKYLSASSNVRRGYAVQNYAKSNLDEYTKNIRIRKKHKEDIQKKRAQLLEGYGDYLGDRSYCYETMCRAYDYDFDQKTEYSYPAPFLAGMTAVSNVPELWKIRTLTNKKTNEDDLPDIGIISRSGVHSLDIHKNNLLFLRKVSFVFVIEPSKLVATAQIGLNLLIKCCGQERPITFCSVDRNCDGLVDALSHILMTNITEVSATEYPHGMSSYMYWTADDEYLQHRILPGVSRCLGMCILVQS